MIAATGYAVSQAVWTILWLCLFFIEVWLTISIFIDIFRSHDLKGWQKALWVVLVLVLPLIGILAYFVVRGDKMRAHQRQDQRDEAAVEDFLRRRHAFGNVQFGNGGGRNDGALEHVHHPPALQAAERPGFHDLDLVADLRLVLLVVDVKDGLAIDDLVIARMRRLVSNGDLDGFVAGTAGDKTNQGLALGAPVVSGGRHEKLRITSYRL